MATTATNWKNVNNWHWVEKNVFPWAKEYFIENLTKKSVTHNGIAVTIESIKDVTGDVDLNQRKGKLMTIYDLSIVMDWAGIYTTHYLLLSIRVR